MSFPVLDVAIGLAFVYLLLAIFCSSLQEMIIASFANLRGKMLLQGLQSMLERQPEQKDDNPRNAKNRPQSGDQLAAKSQPKADGPANAQVLSVQLLAHPIIAALAPAGRLPSYIPANRFTSALLDVLGKQYRTGLNTYSALLRTVAELPEGQLKSNLTMIVREAGGDAERVRAGIERWFDETMDRVTGRYKRQTQNILFALGIAVAIIFNVDSFELAQGLWKEPMLRAAVVQNAQSFVDQKSELDKLPADKRAAKVREQLDGLATSQLPIGWPSRFCSCKWSEATSTCSGQLFLALFGWLFTGLAVALGAPYWFDLLSRLLPMRATGAKPESGGGAKKMEQTNAAVQMTTQTDVQRPATTSAPSSPFGAPFMNALNEFEAYHLTEHDVFELQAKLGLQGGARSGILDQTTRMAIREKQRTLELTETGELSVELFQRILSA